MWLNRGLFPLEHRCAFKQSLPQGFRRRRCRDAHAAACQIRIEARFKIIVQFHGQSRGIDRHQMLVEQGVKIGTQQQGIVLCVRVGAEVGHYMRGF